MNGKSVKACTVFVAQAAKVPQITTIEGLGQA
jgi:aerobic-type carbon monoxide dehydrogenase small subunit (CoxS/CutS family)